MSTHPPKTVGLERPGAGCRARGYLEPNFRREKATLHETPEASQRARGVAIVCFRESRDQGTGTECWSWTGQRAQLHHGQLQPRLNRLRRSWFEGEGSGEGVGGARTVYLLLRSSSWLSLLSSLGIMKKKNPTRSTTASRDCVSGGLISPYPTVLHGIGTKHEGMDTRNKHRQARNLCV